MKSISVSAKKIRFLVILFCSLSIFGKLLYAKIPTSQNISSEFDTTNLVIDIKSSPASFFAPKLFHSTANYCDSNAVFSYSYFKVFIPESFNYHFLKNRLYSSDCEFDIENNLAIIKTKFVNVEIIPPIAIPLEKFWKIQEDILFYKLFYKKLSETKIQKHQESDTEGLFKDIDFPEVKMPRALRKIFGDKLGRLKVTGSQKITVGGVKTVREGEAITESTKKNILPDLKMEQKLDLGINGTIGDKIKVDVEQTSEESIFKENTINVKYEGNEDDPIKLIELGDTQLRLTGSKYISYSASSEDLFGVKGKFEFGKLKFTTILSQEEGQHATASATGTAKEDFSEIRDMDFARNKYFYIGDPNPENPNSIFEVISDELVKKDSLMPLNGTVRVFLHNGGNFDPINDIIGHSIYDTDGDTLYYFQELEAMNDFYIDYLNSPYIITFKKHISNFDVIGIVYETESYIIGDAASDTIEVKLIKKNYTSSGFPEEVLWDYQMKNRYDLGAQNIEKDDFEVKIYQYGSSGEKIEGVVIDTVYQTYVELMGLDRNNDGQVNGYDDQSGGLIDLTAGIINFPYLKPFDSSTFEYINSELSHLGNDNIYDELNPDPTEYAPFYISVKMKRSSSYVDLGYINIIQNSEKVYVNEELMNKGTDYAIDYMSGTVTLKGAAAADPNADVKIDFEYEPFFTLDKKSMMGFRADYEFNKNVGIGATFMYESETVKDKHPQIGGEPQKIIVGDIDGNISFDNIPFLTNLVDKIPLVKTNAKSSLELSGEVAMNIPTPNATDNKEAYLDDMESSVEKFSLGINRTSWSFASWPAKIDTSGNNRSNASNRGNFKWYNPNEAVRAGDIYEEISEQEKREYVTILECKLDTLENEDQSQCWGGIMKAFGSTSMDFSEKKYLEIMINAKDAVTGDSLFVDLGYISEDFYPIMNPNGKLDKEDGLVFEDGSLDLGEDLGLDRVEGADPSPAKNHFEDGTEDVDDGNDDYDYVTDSDGYDKINGTENNGKLDSEDLDGSGGNSPDTNNEYFQYAINLENINNEIQISEKNGWKFLRIPLQDSTFYRKRGANPDFSYIKYGRIWAKTNSALTLKIVSCEIVGNRWKASAILDTSLTTPNDLGEYEEFEVASDNNRDNGNYTPPPGSIEESTNKDETIIEKAIFLSCNEIQPNRYIYARRNLSESVNLLSYEKIKFWVYAQSDNSSEETIVFRIGADTSNYYEYRKKIPVYDDLNSEMKEDRWTSITIDYTELTNLKKDDIPDTLQNIKGSPSLNYVKQIIFGLIRPASVDTNFTGRIYFDDIRLANPYDEIGIASTLSLKGKFADFFDFKISFENKTPNFYSIGADKGYGSNLIKYSLDYGKIHLNKFLPDSWGFNIPLNLKYSLSESKPRFKPNSDVKLTSDKERNLLKTKTKNRSASISINKSKKSSNLFVKYLIDNIFLSGDISERESLSPTKKDTTLSYGGIFKYNLSFSRDNSFKPLKNFKIFYLPQKMSFNLDYDYSRSKTWTKQTLDLEDFRNDTKIPTEKAKTTFDVDYEIFSDCKTDYTLNTTRDLQKRLLFKNMNIGIETSRTQKINLNYNPNFLKFIDFSSSYGTTYNQDRNESQTDDTLTTINYKVGNNRTIKSGLSLKFDKWGKDLMDAVTLPEIKTEEETSPKNEGKTADQDTTSVELSNDIEEYVSTEIEIDSIEVGIDSTQISSKDLPLYEKKKKRHPLLLTAASITGKVFGFGIKNLGNIKVNYTNNLNTDYNTQTDSLPLPDFKYQIGIYDLKSMGLRPKKESDKITTSTSNRFNIFKTLSATVKANYDWEKSETSGTKTEKINYTLPDVSLNYTGFDKIIPWNFVSNSSVSSGISRKISEEISSSTKNSENITINSSITLPLNLIENIDTKITFSHTLGNIKGESSNGNETGSRNQDLRISGNIGYSFRAEKPIKIPLLGKINMKNKLDALLKVSFNSNKKNDYAYSTDNWQVMMDKTTLIIEPGVTYEFSRDIDGGLTAKYERSNDKKSGKSTQTTSLNFWVQFDF